MEDFRGALELVAVQSSSSVASSRLSDSSFDAPSSDILSASFSGTSKSMSSSSSSRMLDAVQLAPEC
ncbi:hypothetical protein KC325_g144 [Hortaea werneckii]|nr:hypothetical protein KC325_g144 [Hortaea werneckii]